MNTLIYHFTNRDGNNNIFSFMGLKTLILSTHFYVFILWFCPFVHILHRTDEKGEPVFSCFDCAFRQPRVSISAKLGFANGLSESTKDNGLLGDAESFKDIVASKINVVKEFVPMAPDSSFVFGCGVGDGVISFTLRMTEITLESIGSGIGLKSKNVAS
jgi:hypothetical protein